MKYDYDEIPKYKKKAKKRSPKKASHKHEWEPVLIGYPKTKLSHEKGFYSDDERAYIRGQRCIFCGRLRYAPFTCSDFIDELNSQEPLTKRYPNYPKVEVDNIYDLND